ncbi:SGNH/GDSL hydrolase family protein [Mesobacillus sp. AQ2]|uniref:SGNH/GDSL hydrolase family protein n=1 Tax=Mesobacillus sp. AQ2 TaxID=3043332 RepID=UPI0024C17336|nr:SGNH/GDSL hydrolase family protein [Mesobacillus sp. AQ2]WHX40395.1 SGNH/GDSL hydrolase family protein [Mesobacillus sp. AQ2]
MKKFILILFSIGCALVLFLGNQQWKEKVQVKSRSTSAAMTERNQDNNPDEDSHKKLSALTKNWPVSAKALFKAAVQEERPFKVILAGSPALGNDESGWAELLKNKLESTYGDALEVTVKSYAMTSQEFIQEKKQNELAAEQADLVLLEPFILMNNGKVANDQASDHYSVIIDAIQSANPNTVVILQPANPLSKARFYPLQVDALKGYAAANGLTYLDHWQAWPETENERMELLAGGDPNFPNEDGHKLWAEYLIDYFIAE